MEALFGPCPIGSLDEMSGSGQNNSRLYIGNIKSSLIPYLQVAPKLIDRGEEAENVYFGSRYHPCY